MIILYDYFKRCATIRKKRQGLLSAKCHVIMYIFFLINSNQCTFNIIIIILDLIIYNNKYIFIKQSNNPVKLVTLSTFDSHRTFRRRPSLIQRVIGRHGTSLSSTCFVGGTPIARKCTLGMLFFLLLCVSQSVVFI